MTKYYTDYYNTTVFLEHVKCISYTSSCNDYNVKIEFFGEEPIHLRFKKSAEAWKALEEITKMLTDEEK